MELSVSFGYYMKLCPAEKAAEALAKVGVTKLDYTPGFKTGDFREELKITLPAFEKYGLGVGQCHMPFNRYGAYDGRFPEVMKYAMDFAEQMKAKYIVCHGDEFDFKQNEYTPEKALEYNYELYAPVVERMTKAGVGVAFENVFLDVNKPRNCSTTEELIALIDRFHTPEVTCCWDFGHANLAFGEDKHPEKIKEMGKRITCTHIHDNYYNKDLHLLPFTGKMDWKVLMKALHDAGYQGNLSFELGYACIPECLLQDYVSLMKKTGDRLIELFGC